MIKVKRHYERTNEQMDIANSRVAFATEKLYHPSSLVCQYFSNDIFSKFECVDLVADTQTNTPKARLLSINSPTSQNLRPTTALPYQREKTFFHVLSRFKYLILGSHNLELASVQMNVLFNHQSDHNIVNPF